jgi:hypothetical protein
VNYKAPTGGAVGGNSSQVLENLASNLNIQAEDVSMFSRLGASSLTTGVRASVSTAGQAVGSAAAGAAGMGSMTASINTGASMATGGIGKLLGRTGLSALLAAPMAYFTNENDFQAGKITKDQRNTLIVADTLGYGVSGTLAASIGSGLAIGAMGPIGGAVVGIMAAGGLGYVYEKYIRPKWNTNLPKKIDPVVVVPPPAPPVDNLDNLYLPK